MSNFVDTTLYTYDRLNNFVIDYKQYINSLFQRAVTADGGEIYQYYHYETTPKAITATDIGRISSILLDSSSAPAWTLQSNYNSTNGWKITLATQYNKQIRPQQDQLLQSYKANGQVKNGLLFNAITIPSSTNYFTNASTFLKSSANFVNIFSQDCSGIVLANQQTAISMDNYSDAVNDPSNNIINTLNNNKLNTYAVEWYGYFYPSSPGNYTFTIKVNPQNSYFLLWLGDKAVCEYTGLNVDITNNTPSFTFVVTQNNYYPIRIQYFSQIGLETPIFSLTIQKIINTTGLSNIYVPIDTQSCLFNINSGNYFPFLQYCAFVSQSPDYFKQGKFQCYLLNSQSNPSDISNFYSIIQQNKQFMQNGTFDVVDTITTFGQLPDQTYYTPVTGNPSSMPDMFSVYRLNTDFRMGNSYQIDTRMNNMNLYPMRQIDANLLSFAEDYNELTGYYPNYTNTQGQSQNPFLGATNLDGDGCKASCNANPNCSFYYTYTSNGNPKCIIDNGSEILQYNQVQPITGSAMPVDLNSSNLFLRNKELKDPGCGQNPVIQIKTLENVSVFNNSSFPFSSYDFSGTPVSKINDVGVCGDKIYNDMNAEAAQILYHNAFYNRNGTFSPSQSTPGQSTPGQSPSIATGPSQNEPFTSRENMTNQDPTIKYTDAVNDTSDSIQANLLNQQKYGDLMQKINQNYQQLGQEQIPEYLKTRAVLEGDNNYDYNGNVLLYLRNKRVPNVKEKNINDINEEYTTHNLVYVLGTLTAATLVVLAIMLARE